MTIKINHYKNDSDVSYALGIALVFELIKTAPKLLTRIFLSPGLNKTSEKVEEIISFCKKHNIEIVENSKPFNVLAPKGNTFIIAEFKKEYQKLKNDEDHIVLVNPSDAGNVGTIIRSAIGFNFTNIAIVSPAVDVYNPKSIRASMGAIFHTNIYYYDNIEEYIKEFPNHNRYAFMLRNASEFSKTVIESPFSLIFGNEASGLPDNFADFCKPIKIQQTENIDSLSLPMAATIAMYENRKIDNK